MVVSSHYKVPKASHIKGGHLLNIPMKPILVTYVKGSKLDKQRTAIQQLVLTICEKNARCLSNPDPQTEVDSYPRYQDNKLTRFFSAPCRKIGKMSAVPLCGCFLVAWSVRGAMESSKHKPESCSEAPRSIRAREDATLQFLKEVRILKN